MKKKKKVGAGNRQKSARKPKTVQKKKKSAMAPRIIAVPKTGGALKKLLTSRIGLTPTATTEALAKIGVHVASRKRGHTRIGKGLYLRPFKQGYGVYLKSSPLN